MANVAQQQRKQRGPLSFNKALAEFERRIGISFQDKSFLETALTHCSYLNENTDAVEHNQRLEFLGDAVLEAVVTYHLYTTMPEANEGKLTNMRAALVNNFVIGKVGEELEIDAYLRMSLGQRRDNQLAEKQVRHIRACAVEAVIGAIRLDRGSGVAELFIRQFLLPRLERIRNADIRDPKEALQEMAQEVWHITPHYVRLNSTGPDHQRTQTVGVYAGTRPLATGVSDSTKHAEQRAARKALREEFDVQFLVWDEVNP